MDKARVNIDKFIAINCVALAFHIEDLALTGPQAGMVCDLFAREIEDDTRDMSAGAFEGEAGPGGRVHPGITVQLVIAAASVQRVVPDTTVQLVIADASDQRVVATKPRENVIPPAAVEDVVARVSVDRVVQTIARAVDIGASVKIQVLEVGTQCVADGRHDQVDAFAVLLDDLVADIVDEIGVVACATNHHVGACAATEDVVARAAIQRVVARTAIEDVVSAEAVDRVLGVSPGDVVDLIVAKKLVHHP